MSEGARPGSRDLQGPPGAFGRCQRVQSIKVTFNVAIIFLLEGIIDDMFGQITIKIWFLMLKTEV